MYGMKITKHCRYKKNHCVLNFNLVNGNEM